MTPQPQTTIQLKNDPQTTPVIIKIGGGGGGPDENQIEIESPLMTFEDQSGDTWNKATSSFSGRIHELTMQDGSSQPLYCKVHPEQDVLTTLKLFFNSSNGEQVFEVGEIVTEDGSFKVEAKSDNVAFTAEQPQSNGTWNTSTATFAVPVKAEFRQRKIDDTGDRMKFEYFFNTTVVALNLDFHAHT